MSHKPRGLQMHVHKLPQLIFFFFFNGCICVDINIHWFLCLQTSYPDFRKWELLLWDEPLSLSAKHSKWTHSLKIFFKLYRVCVCVSTLDSCHIFDLETFFVHRKIYSIQLFPLNICQRIFWGGVSKSLAASEAHKQMEKHGNYIILIYRCTLDELRGKSSCLNI